LVATWVLLLTGSLALWLVVQVVSSAERDAWQNARLRASSEVQRVALVASALVQREPAVLAQLLVYRMQDLDVDRALVVDPQRRIVLSSHAGDQQQLLQLAQAAFLPLVNQADAAAQVVVSEDRQARRLVAVRAFAWPTADAGLAPAALGAAVLVLDVGSMVDAQRRDALQDHIGEGLVLLLASLLLFLGLDWLVASPMDRLREAAERMGGGDLAHRVPGTHVRELDALGRAFNAMGASLQAVLQRVQDSEQRFRALADSAPDAISTLNEARLIDQFNAAAERLFGYRASELIGQPLDRLLPPQLAAEHGAHLVGFGAEVPLSSRRMEGGRVVQGVHRDGHTLHLEIGISRSRAAGSLSFSAMIRDVSDRVAVERELDSHRRQLEDQVRQRTAELILERDRAQAATRAKNEFLARMSHEIRTPMNAVVGLAHVVRRSALASQANQLQTLEDSALRLLALVDDILEFTRLEAGQVALLAAPADPRALVHAVCVPLAQRAARQGVELVEWVDANVPDSVSLDAQRVRQLLGHLVDNAVKFTHSGHVTLHVSLCTVGLRFEVQDSGIGIEAGVLDRIFKPFEQADPGDARRFGGVGLGLVVTQRLLRLMGAELGASSQPGQGSRFHFDLRTLVVPGRAVQGLPALPVRQALVVELHADARAAHLALLRRLGVSAEGAATMEEAEAALARLAHAGQPVDLCLVDARLLAPAGPQDMAQPGGPDVLAGLRCVLTVMDGDALPLADVLRAGYLGVLSKPLSQDTVRDKLATWLSAPTAARLALLVPPPPPAPGVDAGLGPDSLAALRAVPGLDLGTGLRSLRGDVPAYLRLLRRFVDFHLADPGRLHELVARDAGQEVAEMAHSLKSSAGAIGAQAVVAAASAVPRKAQPLDEVRSAGRELAEELAVLLDALRQGLDAIGPMTVATVVAEDVLLPADLRRQLHPQLQTQLHPQLQPQLQPQLRQQLRESILRRDMAALRLLHGAQVAGLGPLGAALGRLRNAVEDFDFDLALKLLDDLESAEGGLPS
jgi:PAS domain S-box-containing protein